MKQIASYLLLVGCLAWSGLVLAQTGEIALIKTLNGTVEIERGGERLAATVGMTLQQADVVRTGAGSGVGITFVDNTLISAGPNSIVELSRFRFDSTTHAGEFQTRVRKGTLAIVSGKIAKQSPDAMTVRTPAAVLAVRGTEFIVKVD